MSKLFLSGQGPFNPHYYFGSRWKGCSRRPRCGCCPLWLLFGAPCWDQHCNWLSAVSVSLIVAVVVGSCYPSFIFVVDRLPKSLYMEEDPYEVRQGTRWSTWSESWDPLWKSGARKRTACIRHRVEEGEDPAQAAIVHQGGQARPLHTPRTWEPNADSSDDGVEPVEHPEPPGSLSHLMALQIPIRQGEAELCGTCKAQG